MKQKLFELNYFIQWNQCFEILQTSKNLLNKMKSSYQENSDQEDNLGVNIGILYHIIYYYILLCL